MSVSYRCPNVGCGVALRTALRVPSGKTVSCPRCGTRFIAEPRESGSDGAHIVSQAENDSVRQLDEVTPITRPQDSADVARLSPAPSSGSPAIPLSIGLEIGDPVPGLSSWLLERQLGVGGFGEVWLAKHEWKTERRAVKFFTHPEARYRLVTHEKKVLVRVMKYAGGHPNIVPLVECNLTSESPWLMYDYVPGGTLVDAMREWQNRTVAKRVSKAIKALFAIASAVGHCHRLSTPIVHRDLKPANVLRDETGVFRVTDFGIGGAAVAHKPDNQTHNYLTNTGRVPTLIRAAGSFGYASPQQRNGDAPNPRDDVYSLGVLAFQLLLGDLSLWPGPDMSHDLRKLGLPRDIVSLLVHSVSHNADRRPIDAVEWKLALESLVARTGSGTNSNSGAPTPAPGSLRMDDPGLSKGESR